MARLRADFDQNNLDFVRLILASVVAFYHLSVLTQLPAFAPLGVYLSPHFAVRAFFVISGILVYRSYTRSSTLRSYFQKRVRRIYPAYFTVIVLSALLLCSLSILPAFQYFGRGFFKYLAANLLFLNFVAPSLPGVFTQNYMSAVNGALWTLKIEVIFYLMVPPLAILARRFGTAKVLFATSALSLFWKFGFRWLDAIHTASSPGSRSLYSEMEVQFPGQMIYFCAGILILTYFDRLRTHALTFIPITLACFCVDHFMHDDYLDVLWISGFVLIFGFWFFLGNFAKYGDMSYGVYIVHWPIIQVLVALGFTRLHPALFLPLAVVLLFSLSFLMWHVVEKRFLARRSHYRQV